jgi:ABC-type Fe3+-siderophore transport system permease subunit
MFAKSQEAFFSAVLSISKSFARPQQAFFWLFHSTSAQPSKGFIF